MPCYAVVCVLLPLHVLPVLPCRCLCPACLPALCCPASLPVLCPPLPPVPLAAAVLLLCCCCALLACAPLLPALLLPCCLCLPAAAWLPVPCPCCAHVPAV